MAQRKNKKKRKFNTNFVAAVRADNERSELESSSYGFMKLPSGISLWSAEPGETMKFDILPYIVSDDNHPDRYDETGTAVPGELWYKRPFKIHRNIGVDKDAVVCPRSVGKPCPICEYMEKRLREGADYDDVRDLKQSKRNLYVVVPKNQKNYEEKPHIWEMSEFLFQKLLRQELQEDESFGRFPQLEDGLTLKVRFDSQKIGEGKPFADASRIDFLERKSDYDEDILDEVPDLDKVLEIHSYKELEAKFMELDPSDVVIEDEDDEEEIPAGRSKAKNHKTEVLDEDDMDEEEFPEDDFEEFEDDDEFDDFDNEEEEEEKPKKSKSKNKQKQKPKQEEEDEDDDEFDDFEDFDDFDDWEDEFED